MAVALQVPVSQHDSLKAESCSWFKPLLPGSLGQGLCWSLDQGQRDGRDRSLRWVAAAQAPVGPIPLVLRYCDWHQRCGALPELDFQKQVGRSKVGWCWHQVLGVPAALENLLPDLEVVLHVEPTWGRVALHKGKAPKGQGTQSLAQGQKARTVSIKKISSMKGGLECLACLFFWCFCEASAGNQCICNSFYGSNACLHFL